MTPKEKADELMDAMLGYGDEHHHCTQYVAKQCALIAVDEILQEYGVLQIETSFCYKMYVYWQEVKQEIEKL